MTACAQSLTLEKILDMGTLVLLPTETVWGVAARARDNAAIDKLYAAKGREFSKPLAVCVKSLAHAQSFGKFDETSKRLAQRHWPGPLTLVVPATAKALESFDARAFGQNTQQKTIAFRCPDTDWRESLCTAPLVLTSANKSGEPDALTERAACAAIPSAQALPYKGSLSGKPSTIISCIDGKLTVLRQGELRPEIDRKRDKQKND